MPYERDIAPILSLAGATANPAQVPIPQRIGGFGGAEGLATFLARKHIDAVVDATHPFASRISGNAVAACGATRTPLVVFSRPPWTREPGDRWIEVAAMDDAVPALGIRPKTVFLTQGRLQLAAFARAPQHRYIVRAIDRPAEIDALPGYKLILARGPFSLADELALMKRERIETLVTKNSGGDATYAKIEAACALEIEVVIVRRPPAPEAETLHDLDAVLAWIADHRRTP
ncbi:MAG TPA: cobalt-precorrin-6A reductase [Roseiarcus sp.]|nr:cobalt-precorrin-6A reductase [Roseiarcus sp.]